MVIRWILIDISDTTTTVRYYRPKLPNLSDVTVRIITETVRRHQSEVGAVRLYTNPFTLFHTSVGRISQSLGEHDDIK